MVRCLVAWVLALLMALPALASDEFVSGSGFRQLSVIESEEVLLKLRKSLETNLNSIQTVSGEIIFVNQRKVDNPRKKNSPMVWQEGTANVAFQLHASQRSCRSEFIISAPVNYLDEISGEEWGSEEMAASYVTVLNPTESYKFYLLQSPRKMEGDPENIPFDPSDSRVASKYMEKHPLDSSIRNRVTSNPLVAFRGGTQQDILEIIPKSMVGREPYVKVGVNGNRVRLSKSFKNNGLRIRNEFDLSKGGTLSFYEWLSPLGSRVEDARIEYGDFKGVWFPIHRVDTMYVENERYQEDRFDFLNVVFDGTSKVTFTHTDLGVKAGDRVLTQSKPGPSQLEMIGTDGKLKSPEQFVEDETSIGKQRRMTTSALFWFNVAVLLVCGWWMWRKSTRVPTDSGTVVKP